MRVRHFVGLATLAVSASAVAGFLLPSPAAHGRPRADLRTEPALPQDDATPAHFVDGRTLLLDGRLGHASIARESSGATAETFLLATVTGAQVAERAAPPPVHMAIAIDRSGSMAGTKMSNAVAAAVGAVERMHDGDRVTVVAFDTMARVVVPPTTIDSISRSRVESSLRAIRAGGDTCISCALEQASESLDASPGTRDEVRRVLLISDGEATTGVRDVSGLRTIAARTRDRGFSVSTIGVDLAFDEKVMAAIAQESNGRHFFVPDSSALSRVFDEEFESLESAVASDAELTIETAPGVVVEDVLDRSFRRESGRIAVPLGTFDAKQEKTVLVRVRVPADTDGVEQVARMTLAYRDVAKRQDARCDGSLAVDVRSDGDVQRDLDPFVAARLERNRTTRTLTEANQLFERGRVDEARAALARRGQELKNAEGPAVAAATAMPRPARGATRDVPDDFEAQKAAVAQAEAAFSAAPPSAAGGAPAATPAGKAATKTNQANAVDLAF